MTDALDRLVRKEVSLGAIREKQPPQNHIGLAQIAPFLNVESDDVIFDYIKGGLQDGLAPARAEDAEAELAQKDELTYGQGRASIIDWSLKDRYSASDVTRYRENLLLQQLARGSGTELQLNSVGRTVADFQQRLARHDTLRRRKLDNRLEWLIMQAVENNAIVYNDGKIKFTVPYGRPTDQTNQAPAGGLFDAGVDHDPIGAIDAMNEYMFERYGVKMRRAITSRKVLNTFWKSSRFTALAGLVVGGTPSAPVDVRYLSPNFGPDAAQEVVERATGVRFIEHDAVWRSRPVGSSTFTNNRFLSENKIFFLPDEADLGEIDDTQLGFGKTLTSPHPEGDWQSGWYEWEDESKDPWLHVRGTGIKAFPVFPYMEYSYTMTVLS